MHSKLTLTEINFILKIGHIVEIFICFNMCTFSRFFPTNFRSELWNLPENCAIPWQEMFADDNENEENKKDSIPDDDMDRLLLEVDDEPLDEIGKEIVEQKKRIRRLCFFGTYDQNSSEWLEFKSNYNKGIGNILNESVTQNFSRKCFQNR